MSDQTPPTNKSASTPASTPSRTAPRRRPRLYRTLLSLAVAALAAAWLPFSVFYIAALNKRAPTVTRDQRPPLGYRHHTGRHDRRPAPRVSSAGLRRRVKHGATVTPVSTHAS